MAATFVLTMANRSNMSSIYPFLVVGALVIVVCLAIGVLTPYLSFIVCLYALGNLLGAADRLYEMIFASVTLTSAALALLGPGAYSVDARLFGRRLVVVPPRKDPDQI